MAGSDDEVTPAGWYRQPDDPDLLRWWDGGDWTDDTMPVPEAARPRSSTKGARKATGGATPRATARASRRTEPDPPRRTRRDAMAEAEAELDGAAPGGTDGDPVEIELERDPASDSGEPAHPLASPSEPEPEPQPDPEPKPAPDADAPPTRRRRATAPGGGPGYVRTTPETVRVLAEPAVPADDSAASGRSPDAAAAGRPRPPAQPRPRAPRPSGQGTRSPQVQRPARPRTATVDRPPAASPRPSRRPVADDDGHRPSRMAAEPSPATAAALLRVLVRAGLIALLLGVAWLGFVKLRDGGSGDAATLSADPAGVTVDPDAPRLDQIILTLADLPRGWSSQVKNPSNGDLCEGRVPESVIEPTASQSAAFTFGDSGAVIGNTVHEFVNRDTAQAYVDLAARVLDSCREQTVDGATTRLVPLDFPRFGDASFVAEITGEGSNESLHGAIVYVRHGHRVASIVTITLDDDALDTELVEHLVELVARRMGSKPAISSERPDDSGGTEIPGG